jgi:cytochrome c556
MTTVEDADKLFNDVTKAMQEDDSNKLSELLAQETPEQEQPDEPELPADEPEEEVPQDDDSPTTEEEETPPTEDKSGKTPNVPDDVADLRAKLQKLEKENHSLRSQAGRVPAVQRKLAKLDKELEALRASPSSQTSTKVKPKVDELLKDVRATDPVLADAISNALAAAISEIEKETITKDEQTLRTLRETTAEEYREAEATRLLEMYPEAPAVFQSPQWSEWKKAQPERVRALALSDNADEVALAFELFARDLQSRYPDMMPAPAATHEVDTDKARQIEETRNRQKQTQPQGGTHKTPVKGRMPMDAESLFLKYSEDIRKNLHGT